MVKKAKKKFHGKTENMGRPPMKPKDRRSVKITVRFTGEEAARLAAEAKRSGRTMGAVLAGPWRSRRGED